jgi:hypothetical protein
MHILYMIRKLILTAENPAVKTMFLETPYFNDQILGHGQGDGKSFDLCFIEVDEGWIYKLSPTSIRRILYTEY